MTHGGTLRALLLIAAFAACDKTEPWPDPDTEVDTDTDADTTGCERFDIEISGEIATIADSPFGLTQDDRLAAVTGTLGWFPCTMDEEIDRDDRGVYVHTGGSVLELSFAGVTVTGSGWAWIDIENDDPDTFRYHDGPRFLDETPRIMLVNGEQDPDLEFTWAVVDPDGTVFSDDSLPAAWPFGDMADHPHTFSLVTPEGTVLAQIATVTVVQ